jgi:hypothetical protein
MEQEMYTYPVWERYTVLAHVIASLNIKERRKVFQYIRQFEKPFHEDIFLPTFGIALTEFAVWYTIYEKRRKVRVNSTARRRDDC